MILTAICGPTGSGKTEAAIRLAQVTKAEILSFDSRQMFRGIPIGTNQPDADSLRLVPHHFIGFLPLERSYSHSDFRLDALNHIHQFSSKNFILVGGTGLYLKRLMRKSGLPRGEVSAEVENRVQNILNNGLRSAHNTLAELDPRSAGKIHPNDKYRITKALENHFATGRPYSDFNIPDEKLDLFSRVPIVRLEVEKELLVKNIRNRLFQMLRGGWVEEVQNWPGEKEKSQAFQSIGYLEISQFLSGQMSRQQTEKEIFKNTCQYAKRQRTFFRTQFPESVAFSLAGFHRKIDLLEKGSDDLAGLLKGS